MKKRFIGHKTYRKVDLKDKGWWPHALNSLKAWMNLAYKRIPPYRMWRRPGSLQWNWLILFIINIMALTSTVLVAEVREAPHVPQPDGEAHAGHDEVHLPGPRLSLRLHALLLADQSAVRGLVVPVGDEVAFLLLSHGHHAAVRPHVPHAAIRPHVPHAAVCAKGAFLTLLHPKHTRTHTHSQSPNKTGTKWKKKNKNKKKKQSMPLGSETIQSLFVPFY